MSRKTAPFTLEQDDLIVELKENQKLPWAEVAAHYRRHFPSKTSGALQVRYTRNLDTGKFHSQTRLSNPSCKGKVKNTVKKASTAPDYKVKKKTNKKVSKKTSEKISKKTTVESDNTPKKKDRITLKLKMSLPPSRSTSPQPPTIPTALKPITELEAAEILLSLKAGKW